MGTKVPIFFLTKYFMKVREVYFKAKKIPRVIYPMDGGEDIKVEKIKGTFYTIPEEIEEYQNSLENGILKNWDEPFQNTGIHGPQGQRGMYDGYKFDSIWEYAYYRWSKDIRGNLISRNRFEYLEYEFEGYTRKFYPDFEENAQFVEIKGIWRPADLEKKAQHPEVIFIDGDDIKPIIEELNNKLPNWRKEYMEMSSGL